MKRIALFFVILLSISAAFAFEHYNTSMGMHFGTSTGSGYSIRQWTAKNGYQVTFAAYAYGSKKAPKSFGSKEHKDGRRQAGQLGLNYLWDLRNTEDYRFYIMSGGSYKLQKVKRFFKDSDLDPEWVADNKWAFGAGPGFEWKLAERFHVTVELPIAYNQDEDIVPYIPAVGMYYYFK